MKRRTFLGSALAGVAAMGSPVHGAKLERGDVPKRVFGKTGEKLTIVGQAGGRFGMITFEEAKAVTLRAARRGAFGKLETRYAHGPTPWPDARVSE